MTSSLKPTIQITEGNYPMRFVTKATGLTAHAVRAWQRRYGAVTPIRTDGNARRFSATDIRRLNLMKMACELGHSIREIANLSEENLSTLVFDARPKDSETGSLDRKQSAGLNEIVSSYVRSIQNFRVADSERIISRASSLLSTSEFCLNIVLPCLKEIGARWHRGELTPAHEHLSTSQLKRILHRMLPTTGERMYGKQVMFATPAHHLHEFGILVAACLTAQYGHRICYLGPNLPAQDAIKAIDCTGPDLFVSSVVASPPGAGSNDTDKFIEQVSDRMPLWIGMPSDHPKWGRQVAASYFDDLGTFSRELQRWAI